MMIEIMAEFPPLKIPSFPQKQRELKFLVEMFPTLSLSDIKNVCEDSGTLNSAISWLLAHASNPGTGSDHDPFNHTQASTPYLRAVLSSPSLLSEHGAEWTQVGERSLHRRRVSGHCRDVGMQWLIEERNKLYRKSGETRLTEVAGFYAAQARDLNRKVQELQMECFLLNNGEMRGNQIDLHGLQTDEAVRQLGLFLAVKETAEGGGKGSVTVVTGWGARSVGIWWVLWGAS